MAKHFLFRMRFVLVSTLLAAIIISTICILLVVSQSSRATTSTGTLREANIQVGPN